MNKRWLISLVILLVNAHNLQACLGLGCTTCNGVPLPSFTNSCPNGNVFIGLTSCPPTQVDCGQFQGGWACIPSGWQPAIGACCQPAGTSCCVPSCACAANTPIGSTCSDGCGGTCAGTKIVSACIGPKFQSCGLTCCDVSSGQFCDFTGSAHCCNAGTIDCNGTCCNAATHTCKLIGGIDTCVINCAPNCACASTTLVGSSCSDGCGGFCAGTKVACVPNCGCAATTTVGSTCADGCGRTCAGTLCVPNCACAATTPVGSTCSDGCSGTCAGTFLPPPPCPVGTICGSLKDAETNSVKLSGVVLELRNAAGAIIQSTKTDINGAYQFVGLSDPAYNVLPVPDRIQSAKPLYKNLAPSAKADFFMRNISALVKVHASPGTFILFTESPWTLPAPPTQGGTSVWNMTGVAGLDAIWNARMTYTTNGYITCWTHVYGQGFVKGNSLALGPIKAQDSIEVNCP